MSRIRSIHPGLFTDEAFMSASAHARLFILGLWTEAWDDGVFEWKPLTLKARIFPVDSVDVAALLAELTELQFICKFSADGKPYGAIRNFRKYQKPKTPNSSGVLPDNLRNYVAIGKGASEAIPNDFGNGSEKSVLMEDGGGKREEEKKKKEDAHASSARDGLPDFKKGIMAAFHAAGSTAFPDTSRAAIWLERGWKPEICLAVISEVLSRNRSVTALKYFEQPIADAHQAPVAKSPAQGQPTGKGAAVVTKRLSIDENREHAKATGQFYVLRESPAGEAWNAYKRKTKGVSQWWDQHGGNYFPSEFPPDRATQPEEQGAAA